MGLLQTLNSYLRLNNKPLDISLTFDNLLEAKKYVAGLDTSKGTPYNGQIISVNNMSGTPTITATFKIVNDNVNDEISSFRLVLLDAYSKNNGTYFHEFNLVTKNLLDADGNSCRHLLVYRHMPNFEKFENDSDILMSNKAYCYSLLALLGLFYRDDNFGKFIKGTVFYGDANGSNIIVPFAQEHNVSRLYEYKTFNGDAASIGGAIYINNNRLIQDSGNFISFSTNQPLVDGVVNGKSIPAANKHCIEIYVNIEDYLNRNGVI